MDLASGDSVRLEDLVLELWPLTEPSVSTVDIKELKNRLTQYIRRTKQG